MYKIKFHPLAIEDLERFNKYDQKRILNKIKHYAQNPLPKFRGGIGEPLSNYGQELAGCCKGKVDCYRFVYELFEVDEIMYILVIGFRREQEVYEEAQRRIE